MSGTGVFPAWLTALLYLLAAVLFILALKGLSSPKSARRGNLLGALGAVIAVVTTFFSVDLSGRVLNLILVLVAIMIGSAIAVPAARRIKMTQMPQLVALFNGVGGGAAAFVGIIELHEMSELAGLSHIATSATAFAVLVGAVSLAGSILTFLKLDGRITARPIVLPGAPVLMAVALLGAVAAAVLVAITGSLWGGVVLFVLGIACGLLLVLPVGGADVPIVISLLNAFTGLTVAASGWAMSNTLLLVAGTLVGASGTILTIAMATAMGRSVTGILFGALKGGSTAGSTEASDRPVRRASAEDVAISLGYARRVVIVPGYGLAVAQAQHTLAELVEALRTRGVDAVYGIHPVAGRMPGHMNVLLAEANVPYELLLEADDVNAQMPNTDVVVVVGANDVVNPAARDDPSAPIYGMPIINADEAHQIFFLKRSMRPGFAGIENELLFDPKTQVLFGDAKASLGEVLASLKTV